jgi:predicted porin
MNKKILAVAVSAALMAGASAAMADVTVYGKMHVSVDSMTDGDKDTATANNDTGGLFFNSNSSRLGFKGSEDLGNGLKAVFKIESTIDNGEAGGTGSNTGVNVGTRNTYVGLTGGFGTVLAGQHDTPMKGVSRKFDLFGDTVGDSRNVVQAGLSDARVGNVLAYANKFGPANVMLAYIVEDGADSANGLSANVMYKEGPLTVGAGYQSTDKGLSAANSKSESGLRLGATYDLGSAAITGFYQTMSNVGGTNKNDNTSMGVGAAMPMGGNTFKAQYYTTEQGDTNPAKATLIALGVDHKLSKSTKVYAMYAQVANKDGGAYVVGGGGHSQGTTPSVQTAATDDVTMSAISLGMVHNF